MASSRGQKNTNRKRPKPRAKDSGAKSGGTRSTRTSRQWAFVLLKWGTVLGLLCGALGAASLAGMFWYFGSDPNLPSESELRTYKPFQVSRVLAADGQVIGEIFKERRTFIDYKDIPKLVVHAFVSAEDSKFFEHKGIDYVGMVRAAIANVKAGRKKQGASTITQQVVKTLLLTPERTFKRKFQEIILSRRVESTLSKEEILTLYLNQIYFGHGRYGIREAAEYYFGKQVSELHAGEVAMLAGLPQAPENISPKKPKNRDRAKRRQIYVLSQMASNGYIAESEAQKYVDASIAIVEDAYPNLGDAPEWIELARRELRGKFGEDNMQRAGVDVTMSVDLKLQAVAKAALRRGLQAHDRRQGVGYPVKRIKKDKIELEVARLAKRRRGTPKPGKLYRGVVREVSDTHRELRVDLGKWEASLQLPKVGSADRFNPDTRKPSERFKRGDVVRVRVVEHTGSAKPVLASNSVAFPTPAEGAIVVIDPRNRRVLAMVGGYDSGVGDFNRAVQAKRQPGSVFKPIVYAAAIDTGDFTPATIVNDAPEVYDLWKPENYKKGQFAGPVRLRHALAKSINTVAIRVMNDVGPTQVAELAHNLGIKSDLPEQLSLALGSGEVNPLELTNAFASIAAGGEYRPPVLIAAVGDTPVSTETPKRVLRESVAFVTADMMRSVVEEGTGVRAKKLNIPISGKTGTSNDARDAWFIGMTPELVVGVWVGYDNPKSLGRREGGSRTALPIFVDLLEHLRPRSRRFTRPAGVALATIDKATGLLAADGTPPELSYAEVFVEGTEPTEVTPAPGEVSSDNFVTDQYEDGYGDADAGE